MFSHQQIEHFKAFGFVVARGLLDDAEVGALKHEVVRALTEAYGGLGTDTNPEHMGGIRGDYLPLALDRTPVSQALMADDPRLFQGSAELLARLTVPTVPIAACFTSNAGWHNEHGSNVGGVKFLTYLDARTADSGALRVLPGSHIGELAARLATYWSQDPAASGFERWPVPAVVVETEPGDVIAFDAHLFHSSAGGSTRLAWSIEYLPWPGLGDPASMAAVRDYVTDVADLEHKPDDPEKWPTWREWASRPNAPDSRHVAIQRLRLLGMRF